VILSVLPGDFWLIFIGEFMVHSIIKVEVVIFFVFSIDRSGQRPKFNGATVLHILLDLFTESTCLNLILFVYGVER
jgi:hypothetical protein